MASFRLSILALLAVTSVIAGSSVSGRVFDPQGLVLPGATVKLQNPAGFHATATSDAEGHYIFVSVPDGDCQLKAEAPGLAAVS